MKLTDEQYNQLEAEYWDAYRIRGNELAAEQADVFDELSAETTQECRRAGIRRMADELSHWAAKARVIVDDYQEPPFDPESYHSTTSIRWMKWYRTKHSAPLAAALEAYEQKKAIALG